MGIVCLISNFIIQTPKSTKEGNDVSKRHLIHIADLKRQRKGKSKAVGTRTIFLYLINMSEPFRICYCYISKQ